MTAELINTGSELLLGRVLNTHQQWICRLLSDAGFEVGRQTAVPDSADAITFAVSESLGRADLVITTGGLGPTGDDLTRERVAALLGRKLEHDPAVAAQIRHFFESRGRAVPPRTDRESLVPSGAIVLTNRNGTAPGLAIEVAQNPFRDDRRKSWVILLPGPPRELRPMFRDEVMPLLRRVCAPEKALHTLTLRTTGLGESALEEALGKPLSPLQDQGLELGFCAKIGEVEVRFAIRGEQQIHLLGEAEIIARVQIGPWIFGTADDLLEHVVVQELIRSKRTLALAESCTGGFVAHRITNIPGASAVLLAGFVTYANTSKVQILGVDPGVLAANGAVSAPVAQQMAEGARRISGSDYALSVTGIAGPGGGSEAKPVGTAFIGLAAPDGTTVVRQLNSFDRETFKFATSQNALELLRRRLLGLPSP